MKKILLPALFTFTFSLTSMANGPVVDAANTVNNNNDGESTPKSSKFERSYGMAGCGLGSVVIGKRGAQLFASTTNGTASNQLFGITSGTLGCIDQQTAKVASQMDTFIKGNRATLEVEISRGAGEGVNALSSMMGCENQQSVGELLKQNYSAIFNSNQQKTEMEITDAVLNSVLNNSAVKNSCKKLVSFS